MTYGNTALDQTSAMLVALAQLHADLVALTAAIGQLNGTLVGGINVHIL